MKGCWKKYFRIGISIFLLYLCIHYWAAVENLALAILGAASPLFIGCIIAYVVNILMCFYEKHYFPKKKCKFVEKSRMPVCISAAFLTIISIVTLISALVVPQLISCVQLILAKFPGAVRQLISWLERFNFLPDDIAAYLAGIDWAAKISEYANVLISGIGNVAGILMRVVSSVFDFVVTAFLATIFAIYLLIGKRGLFRHSRMLLKKCVKGKHYERLVHVLKEMNGSFHRYIVGQCTEALILGVLCALGMLALQLPYAAMIGSLIAFTALIPVAGAFIGGAVGAIMIFTVSPIKALVFIVFLLVLQQLENNIIFPRVVGSSLGVPSLWVLAAVTVGGGIGGVIGMIISVPIAATVFKLSKDALAKAEENENGGNPSQKDSECTDAPTEAKDSTLQPEECTETSESENSET